MPNSFLKPYSEDLASLARADRRRSLARRQGLDFSSNDYLALATSDRLRKAVEEALARGVNVGASGSRLLRGNDDEHEALELEAARVFGAERALFFISGFMANAAVFAALPQRGDLVVYDELIHASAHDGMRLGRSETVSFRHNDPQAAEDAIRVWRAKGGAGRPWIAVESLYSMDGDRANLSDFKAIADAHDGGLIVDEAHATGVFGEGGHGLWRAQPHHENVIVLHTCGKALGVSGALVTGPADMCDFLVNRSRAFIFSTAPSPLLAAAVREALKILADEPWRRERLAALIAHAGQEVEGQLGLAPSGSQIQPIIIGEDAQAMALAAHLQNLGYDIRGIRPPTVPTGTSRLRLAITLHADEQSITGLVTHLAEQLAGAGR